MTDMHTEIERKFDVDASFVLPPLDTAVSGASTVATEVVGLEAVYFDTADLRLAQRKITLRRRSGGADQGWNLKLPVARSERQEIHEPFTDELTVPDALARLVLASTRGAQLAPVARLVTTRTAHRLIDDNGVVQLEVAEDTVTGQTLGETTQLSSWREVEVELVDGEPRQLARVAKVLGKAGAQPSASGSKLARTIGVSGRRPKLDLAAGRATAGEVVLAYLRGQHEVLLATDPAVRLDRPDAVHRMRVASRRLRSALKTFAPLFTGDEHLAIEDGLHHLAEVLGHERDAEVLLTRMRRALDDLPAELVMGPVRHDVETWMGDTYFAEKATSRAYLDGTDYTALLDRLEEFLTSPTLSGKANRPARQEIAHRLDATITKVQHKGRAALASDVGEARDRALHDARKAAKRSRYAADLYHLINPKAAARVGAQMSALQDVLGDRHDGAVLAVLLRQFAARTGANGGNGFTYGFLLAREETRGTRVEEDFSARLNKLRTVNA